MFCVFYYDCLNDVCCIFLFLGRILQNLFHYLTKNRTAIWTCWAYIWRKTWSKRIHAPQCSLQHCLLLTAKSLQSCPTLYDPIDRSPPGSPVLGIPQARTLEWVAISFSNAWKWRVKVKLLSRVRLLATPGLQPTRLLCPWDFPGKSTRVGCHCLPRNVYNSIKSHKILRNKFNQEGKKSVHWNLEKAMAPHSSTLAWKIPWMEEPVGCSPWGR